MGDVPLGLVVAFCQGPDWHPRKSTKDPGTCGACGADLVGRNHWFCPSPFRSCRVRYAANHFWGEARSAAIHRDEAKCQRCGTEVPRGGKMLNGVNVGYAEVNHIEPRNGAGYAPGCHNHQDNLETLCHDCHVATTTQQIRERKRLDSPQIGMATTPSFAEWGGKVSKETKDQAIAFHAYANASLEDGKMEVQDEEPLPDVPEQGVAGGTRGSAATAATVDALRAWLLAPHGGLRTR